MCYIVGYLLVVPIIYINVENSSSLLLLYNKYLTLFSLVKLYKGAFTPNVKSVLSENLGGILGGNPMLNGWLFKY